VLRVEPAQKRVVSVVRRRRRDAVPTPHRRPASHLSGCLLARRLRPARPFTCPISDVSGSSSECSEERHSPLAFVLVRATACDNPFFHHPPLARKKGRRTRGQVYLSGNSTINLPLDVVAAPCPSRISRYLHGGRSVR
jgi:hypothetical protein